MATDNLAQLAKTVEWLDEERRRDKANIARLEERITQQNEIIAQLTRRLSGLENDQVEMRSKFMPADRYDDLLETFRTELQQQIEQIEERRAIAERESERRHQIARESIIRPVRELGERIDRLERLVEEIPSIHVERERLMGIITTLQAKIEDLARQVEERDRSIAFLEEQRRQDARRISEIQAEIPELQKKIDSIKPKLELVEELALRNEKRVLELQGMERERREQIQQFIERQNLIIQQREQRIEEVLSKVGTYDDDMQRYMERFETWAETYRQMKRVLDDFERMSERLVRRINEVAEMQRLSEERFRQEWNEFGADDQKRWKQFTLAHDEAWREHEKVHEDIVRRIAEVAEQIPGLTESLHRLWELERARANLYLEGYQALLTEYDTVDKKRSRDGGQPVSE